MDRQNWQWQVSVKIRRGVGETKPQGQRYITRLVYTIHILRTKEWRKKDLRIRKKTFLILRRFLLHRYLILPNSYTNQ